MNLIKPKFWKSKFNFFSIILLPLSVLYKIFLYARKFFTKVIRFKANIICVGNIYVGGTGKTPLSILIYKLLIKHNKNPAIIKKFYKNQFDEINLISSKVNDLFVNKSRRNAIDNAISKGFKTIVLDDGFQLAQSQAAVAILVQVAQNFPALQRRPRRGHVDAR